MYTNINGFWRKTNGLFINISGYWRKVNSGFVNISGFWRKFFSAEPIPTISTYPKVRNSSLIDINNTTVKSNLGSILYGYRGSWLNNPTSYEDKWQWSSFSGGPYSDFSPSQTAFTLDTSTHITGTGNWDKRYIVYLVRATNATGTSSWVTSSNEAHLVKYTPSNISISISGTAIIGQTLIGISSWQTTNINAGDWTPDTYLYEWIYGDTGTAAFNSTNSSNYTITSEDNGHTIKVKITATNSGGSTTATSTATSTITVAIPTNTIKPTFSLLSGTANKVGAVYRLSSGSWLNTPTSYTYYLDRNNAGGTNVLSLNQSGAYYDWTVGGTYGGDTLSFSVTATNAGGTSTAVYCLTSLGAFTYLAPTASSYPSISGTGVYNTNIIYAAGSYNYAASITTQLIISSNTSFTSTSGAKGGTSPYTVNNIDVAGTPYTFATRDTVVGLDGNTYYFYSGGFSGTSVTIPNGSGSILSSALAGLTPTLSAITKTAGGFTTALTNYNASYTWDVITSAGSVSPTTLTGNQTITVSGLGNAASATVTVFSSRSGYQTLNTPIVGTSKALYTVTYSVINGGTVSPASESVYEGASVNLPTPVRSGYTAKWYTASSVGTLVGSPGDTYFPSGNISLYAQWTLTPIYPTVTIAANTSVTTTTGQINWTSTNQYGFSVDGAFAASGSPSSSSGVYKTGLTPNTTYTGTITVTSSTGNTATASYSLTTPPIPVYTITYLKNDGSGTAQGTSTFTSGGPTTSASTPTRAGYTFNGWYDTGSLDYTYLVQASTSWFPPDGNRNMYARWTLTPVIPTITMGANSGVTQTSGTINWSSSNQSSFSSNGSISGTGTTATSITNNSLSPGTTYTGTVTVTSSTGNTASANYSLTTSPAQYTVTWNAGGGSGGGSTGPFNAGTAHTAPSPGTITGYTFNGYFNTPSGDYLYGAIASGGSFTPTSSLTMHARWTASTSAPGTPVVSGDNSLSVGGTFTWSCTGSPTPVYRVTIGYNASNSAGPFSTRYQQPSAALTTSNGLSITSIRPGYDLSPGLGWAGTGYYRCTIQAINSAGGPTTGSATVYMS